MERHSNRHLRTRLTGCEPRGLTIIEVLVVIAVLLMLAAVFLSPPCSSRQRARQVKDGTQVRGMIQSMIIWAEANKGQYPLPSVADAADATIQASPETKNTTANILSLLIYNGSVSPDNCVSPAEASPKVEWMTTYQYKNPSTAARPAEALWDPAFRGTPFDSGPIDTKANQSYAHILPFGKRRELWKNNTSQTLPVFGNRGPTYLQDDFGSLPEGRWSLLPGDLGTRSTTLLVHGGRTTWEGNIGYNDDHVNFESSPTPESVRYRRGGAKGMTAPDNLFVNESDEDGGDPIPGSISRGLNAYLRPIAKVQPGATPNDVRATLWRD